MDSTEPLRILHVTDLHLHAGEDAELYGVRTNDSFRAVVGRALTDDHWRPDIVLVTGDLVEDCSREGYERFRSIMKPFGLPVLCIPGNHDNPDLMAKLLNDGGFSFCASHDAGQWRLILLNSHVPGDEGGELSESELNRLERDLADAEGRFVLVCVHHQPIAMGSAWIDGLGLRNGPELLSIVTRDRRAKAVLWGHVHQASDRQYKRLRMLSTPSTCAQFTPGTRSCVMDIRPPGFRRLTLKAGGGIATEVLWLDDWIVTQRPPDSRIEDQTVDSG